jgi:4-amino-4-deoxy-L-arabinose transferase-like glycosyltransferase
MTGMVGRAVAAAALAALLGAAGGALFYAWHPELTIEFDRDFPRMLSGVYSPERDEASGLTFAWTGADVMLRLPGLDRDRNWTLDLRVRGGRPLPSDNPDVTVLADGVTLAAAHTSPEFQNITVTIPARPDRRGLSIGVHSSKTFVPGPGDPRPLGVMLDRLSLVPDGIVLVPRPALYASSLSAAAMGVAIAMLGVTAGSAIAGAVLLSAGGAAVITRGFGPFTEYPETVTAVGLWIALALAGSSLAVRFWRRQPLRNTARFAAAFTAGALFLKLLVLLHPNMPVGDAMFHAHRFQGVLGGNLYFTSIAPGGYAFPYPPGLYVFASLFAGLVRRGVGDMALLRVVTCSVDAATGLLLYYVVARAWGNRLAGAMAVAIYHLIPVNLAVLTTGNLTNAFAQSVAMAALALMASDRVSMERRVWTALLAAALAAAYLSHTSTLAILFTATVATTVLFWWRGEAALRSPAAAIALATAGAALLAIAAYYAHFMDTYRAEFARIGHETATAAAAAGGRTIGDRFLGIPYSLEIYLGVPILLLAFLGAVELARRRGRDRLTLVLTGWIVACLAFLVIGVLTPVDMRHYLAAAPALAIASGYGAAWAWSESTRLHRTAWRVAAAVLLAATISAAFHNWWNTLG